MTLPQLLTLAQTTLAQVPHHAAVTPELCAAICWQESRGDAAAVGDKGLAFGVAQFHLATWYRFRRMGLSCARHSLEYCHRDCAKCTMRVLIAELSYAARRTPINWTPRRAASEPSKITNRLLCRFHSAGRLDVANTRYCRDVARIVSSLGKRPNRRPPARVKIIAASKSKPARSRVRLSPRVKTIAASKLKAQGSRLKAH